MTAAKRTPQDQARHRSLADAAAGWAPRRGDIVYDAPRQRTGVVIALPEDTGAPVYHLCPPGGGRGWTARLDDLRLHEDDAPDGMTANESVMPPPEAFGSALGCPPAQGRGSGREGV